MMTHPHDPDEVDQTMLPGAAPSVASPEGTAPPDNTPARHADATVAPAARDPEATFESAARPGAAPHPAESTNESTSNDVEATLLPSGTAAVDVEATGDFATDPGATMAPPGAGTMAATGPSGGRTSHTAPASVSGTGAGGRASPSTTGTMVGRFALRELHAKGGLGEVFTARDTELNREVAVKRIKGQYADDPGSRRRFLTEAELTAKLDHPGVVPVFGLVNDVRGRPCYAMRFIRGETLKDEIERFHGLGAASKTPEPEKTEKSPDKPADPAAAPAPSPVPAPEVAPPVPRTVAFRNLLQRFVATCQTIAYAHTKNIIHRDIKPANIMVGAFGETLVVDWGLAKSLLDGPDFDRLIKAADEAGFRHDAEATELPSHITQAGTAVGTPAYMAPEQAAGQLDKVGPRADIYALGATLYAILTGKAPYSGKTAVETLDHVRRGTYPPPTSINPECPKPLEAIVRKAMALNPDDRYATALDLAADVERWESDEPVSCYPDPLFARVTRWGRRHPAGVAAAVSLLFAGVLAAGAIAWTIHEGEKETSRAYNELKVQEEKTKTALDQVTKAQGETHAALKGEKAEREKAEGLQKKAQALEKVARARYVAVVASYNTLVRDIDAKLADRAGMQQLRTDLLLNAIRGLELLTQGEKGDASPDVTLVAAHRQLGEVYQSIGNTKEARTNFQKAVDLARTVQKDAPAAEKRAADLALGRSLAGLAGVQLLMGETKPALGSVTEAGDVFSALVAANPSDTEAKNELASARARRGAVLMEQGDTGGAAVDYAFALGTRETLAAAARTDPKRPPEEVLAAERAYAASLDDFAAVQFRTGRTADALKSAQSSWKVRADLAKAAKDRTDLQRELAAAHGRLGDIHLTRGNTKAAETEYTTGVTILEQLLLIDRQNAGAEADLADLLGRLGQLRLRTGDGEAALKGTEAGRDRALKLYGDDKTSAEAARDLARARELYGDALLAAARADEALKEYEASEALLRPLAGGGAGAKLALARALEGVGDAKLLQKDFAGAVRAFDESVTLRRGVVKDDKDSASAKRDLAVGLYKLANARGATGAPGATAHAVPLAVEATDLFVLLTELDKENKRAERDLALAYGKWGTVLAADGRGTLGLVVAQRSFTDLSKLAQGDPDDSQLKEETALATERLAAHYSAVGFHDRALEAAKDAVKLWKELSGAAKNPYTRARLALALLRCGDVSAAAGKLTAARAAYKEAADEIAPLATDPFGKKVAQQVADQFVFLDAVETARLNPADVAKFPAAVRVPALVTVAQFEVSADHPVDAARVIDELAKIAATPAEKFTAARLYAGCAAAKRGPEDQKKFFADKAVEQLKRAAEGANGFRDVEALTTSEWAAVAERNKEFGAIVEKLKKEKK